MSYYLSGKNMIYHQPVMADEVLSALAVAPGRHYIDATIGGGGHAEKILAASAPDGRLLGFDADGDAIQRTSERLRRFGKRVQLVRSSYTNIKQIVYDKKFSSFHGIFADLGLSSDQLQNSGRGFSFQVNEPLDMRFAPDDNELTAAQIVNEWPAREIEKILFENADEKQAKKIVAQIVTQRKNKRIETTGELAQIILAAAPVRSGKTRIHPATKTFQALRMAVNNEIENIRSFLKDSLEIMPSGCRLVVITFHSGEDRIVKNFFKQNGRGCVCPPEIPVCVCGHRASLKIINRRPITPTELEIEQNFRARSAKLRFAEKI